MRLRCRFGIHEWLTAYKIAEIINKLDYKIGEVHYCRCKYCPKVKRREV